MPKRSMFLAGGAMGSIAAIALASSSASAQTTLNGTPFNEDMVLNKGKIPKPYRLSTQANGWFVDALANASTEFNNCYSNDNTTVTLTAAIEHIQPSQIRYAPGIAKEYASVTSTFAQFSPIGSLASPQQLLSWQNTWWLFDPNKTNDVPIMQLGTAQANQTFIGMPVPGGQLTATLAFLTGIDPNKALHTFINIIAAITPIQGSASFTSLFPIAAASLTVVANVEQLLNQLLLLGPGAQFEREFSNNGFTIVLHQSAPSAGQSVLHIPKGRSTYAFVAEPDASAFDAAVSKIVSSKYNIRFASSDGFRVIKTNGDEVLPNPLSPFTIVGAQFNSTQQAAAR